MKFTEKELLLINDKDLLLRKQEVMKKITCRLHEVEQELKKSPALSSPLLPQATLTGCGKISKGEQYRSLPYLVLDYPRFSANGRFFLYRTMFWWGHYFLCLLISRHCGHQLNREANLHGYALNTGDTPWHYDLSGPEWQTLSAKSAVPAQLPFICIGKKVKFDAIGELAQQSRVTFETLMSFLTKK